MKKLQSAIPPFLKKPWVKIVVGLVLGIAFGLIVRRQVEVVHLIGQAFLDLLKMLVGIIVFTSLVNGICHINDPKKLGRIGYRTLLYYGVTTVIAVVLGILFTFLIGPGRGLGLTCSEETCGSGKLTFSMVDFIFSIVPSNPFAAFAEGNMLQIIVFAIFFAFAITISGEKGKPVLGLIESISEVMYTLTHFIMRLAPYGIFALIATSVGNIGFKIITPLLLVLACNYAACVVQVVCVFGLSLKYLARLEVGSFFKGMKDAMVLACTTSSSSATLPVSIECARDNLGISPDIAGFVMSLGSTINMNGAAIGQAVASIFIAQAYGIELTFVKLAVLIATSLLSAIGAAGIPGTGLVMLTVVLTAMGLPLEGIGIIAGIDRLREMVSSVVNVLGDAAAAAYIAKKENQMNEKRYHAVTWLE